MPLVWFSYADILKSVCLQLFAIFGSSYSMFPEFFFWNWMCIGPFSCNLGHHIKAVAASWRIIQSSKVWLIRLSLSLCLFFCDGTYLVLTLSFYQDMHNCLLHIPHFLWEGEFLCSEIKHIILSYLGFSFVYPPFFGMIVLLQFNLNYLFWDIEWTGCCFRYILS